ncbi:MAG: NAD(P)-dependent alcohol dehydrogenase [Kineosporiaceae bacterium]
MSTDAPTTMAAVVHSRYGEAGSLIPARLPVPVPGKGEVLVRVRAVALNPADVFFLRGRPAMVRLACGLTRPRNPVRGQDVAGVVEALGPGVEGVAVGEEVFGGARGGLAELAVARADHVVPLPPGVPFDLAAASVMTGLAAIAALRRAGAQAGERILVVGASGGIGTLVVQLAVAQGLEVTGVCSSANVELVRSLGASQVVDYTTQDVLACGGGFDVVLDNVGAHRMTDLARLLRPGGRVLPNSGMPGPDGGALARVLKASALGVLHRGRYRVFTSGPNPDDLAALRVHLADGTLRPVIEGRYPLDAAAEAMARVATGHVAGKVVVTLP